MPSAASTLGASGLLVLHEKLLASPIPGPLPLLRVHTSFLGLCCTAQVALEEEFHSPGGQAQMNGPLKVIPDFLLSDMHVDQPDSHVALSRWLSIFLKNGFDVLHNPQLYS